MVLQLESRNFYLQIHKQWGNLLYSSISPHRDQKPSVLFLKNCHNLSFLKKCFPPFADGKTLLFFLHTRAAS